MDERLSYLSKFLRVYLQWWPISTCEKVTYKGQIVSCSNLTLRCTAGDGASLYSMFNCFELKRAQSTLAKHLLSMTRTSCLQRPYMTQNMVQPVYYSPVHTQQNSSLQSIEINKMVHYHSKIQERKKEIMTSLNVYGWKSIKSIISSKCLLRYSIPKGWLVSNQGIGTWKLQGLS